MNAINNCERCFHLEVCKYATTKLMSAIREYPFEANCTLYVDKELIKYETKRKWRRLIESKSS